MDFIKETYELLTQHLGEEHRGRKQLGPQHADLCKEVQNLIMRAIMAGKIRGMSVASSEFMYGMKALKDSLDDVTTEYEKDLSAMKKFDLE